MALDFRFGAWVFEQEDHVEKVIEVARYEHGAASVGLHETDLRSFYLYQFTYGGIVLDTKRFFNFIDVISLA